MATTVCGHEQPGRRLAKAAARTKFEKWRPFHIIGLETSISVLSAVLRGEATGTAKEFRGDAVATAKCGIKVGDILDGEGGGFGLGERNSRATQP